MVGKKGGAGLGQGRHKKNWKSLNLKIDVDLWDYLHSISENKGDKTKTKIIEKLIRELKLKNDETVHS